MALRFDACRLYAYQMPTAHGTSTVVSRRLRRLRCRPRSTARVDSGQRAPLRYLSARVRCSLLMPSPYASAIIRRANIPGISPARRDWRRGDIKTCQQVIAFAQAPPHADASFFLARGHAGRHILGMPPAAHAFGRVSTPARAAIKSPTYTAPAALFFDTARLGDDARRLPCLIDMPPCAQTYQARRGALRAMFLFQH